MLRNSVVCLVAWVDRLSWGTRELNKCRLESKLNYSVYPCSAIIPV